MAIMMLLIVYYKFIAAKSSLKSNAFFVIKMFVKNFFVIYVLPYNLNKILTLPIGELLRKNRDFEYNFKKGAF